ncbi:hypothetical protein [Pararhizobium arenae]|uniref:hypothetical protein n=1 Tax=Pararhizobium arenae TaxID=1856850 RepID=UPI00094AD672|nr:hypothetical protein [Pararhizobium arenae]
MLSATTLKLIDAALEAYLPHVTDNREADEGLVLQRGLSSLLATLGNVDRVVATSSRQSMAHAVINRIETLIAQERQNQIAEAGLLLPTGG